MRTTYTATVEVATKDRLDVETMMSALVDYYPVMAVSPRGWHQIRLSVQATNLTQACVTAIAVATAATGAAAISCDIMTVDVAEDRQGGGIFSQTRGVAGSY